MIQWKDISKIEFKEKELNGIKFNGYEVDLFMNDDGTLGLTVSKKEHSIDIFVDKNLNNVVGF